LELLTGLFAGFLLISNLASTRIIEFGPLEFDAGTLMFPLTYIFGDLLTEVYGFAKSRRVIWTGFLTLFLATVLLYVASIFPAAQGWEDDEAWQKIMGLVPRLALGSLLAYLLGEFANSITLAKMKAKCPQKGPAWRFVASTMVGQVFDTFIFASIAFLGVLDMKLWWYLVFSNYVFKVGVEIILLPLTLVIVRALKKTEGLDPVDKDISYNPFQWSEKPEPSGEKPAASAASVLLKSDPDPKDVEDQKNPNPNTPKTIVLEDDDRE
jgi:uncharacterized integral membrane protein (TIGR00697 family)